MSAFFLFTAVSLLVGSPWLVDLSGPEPFYKGPLLFPLIALGIMAAGAVPATARLLMTGWRQGPAIDGHGFPRTAAKLFVLMCCFPLALQFIGLEASSFLFATVGLWVTGYGGPLARLTIATGMTVVLYLVFKVILDVWFPVPAILDLVGAPADG